MKFIITTYLVLIWGCLIGQNSDYFALINKAELSICKENFSEANILYNKAFSINKTPSIYDRYNSLMVLEELNDNKKYYKTIFENIVFLVSKAGLTLDFFENNNDLTSFKSDSSLWINFFKKISRTEKRLY